MLFIDHFLVTSLICPCGRLVDQCSIGEKAGKKIDVVLLSNNTVLPWINDIDQCRETTIIQRYKMARITPSIWMNKWMRFSVFVNVNKGAVKRQILKGRCDSALFYTSD